MPPARRRLQDRYDAAMQARRLSRHCSPGYARTRFARGRTCRQRGLNILYPWLKQHFSEDKCNTVAFANFNYICNIVALMRAGERAPLLLTKFML